jgi:DNA-binding transcriptional LysR family regulator
MGNPPNSNLIARQLAALPCYVYASPNYIKQFGEPKHPLDLTKHECLIFRSSKGSTWTLNNKSESIDVSIKGRFQVNSVGMIRKLVSLGMGVAVMPSEIVSEDVMNGRIQRILTKWEAPSTPVYAMTETRLLPAKTQRFIEFLQENLRTRV